MMSYGRLWLRMPRCHLDFFTASGLGRVVLRASSGQRALGLSASSGGILSGWGLTPGGRGIPSSMKEPCGGLEARDR
ncbi:hypothetical protein CRUP_034479 [Coryphaenoides rupestris]|nr:hypothetical protein CRUP_034479 [Coryphaenoides rupestris]